MPSSLWGAGSFLLFFCSWTFFFVSFFLVTPLFCRFFHLSPSSAIPEIGGRWRIRDTGSREQRKSEGMYEEPTALYNLAGANGNSHTQGNPFYDTAEAYDTSASNAMGVDRATVYDMATDMPNTAPDTQGAFYDMATTGQAQRRTGHSKGLPRHGHGQHSQHQLRQ
jgi:hypothetical protein